MPRVNDRVMCEANYQPNMPVKWNAEMVRLLEKGGRGGGSGGEIFFRFLMRPLICIQFSLIH